MFAKIRLQLRKNYSKDQIQQNIAIPMRFTKKARLFKSSAPQLITMISKF